MLWVFFAARERSLVAERVGYSLVAAHWLLVAEASLVEYGPEGVWAQWLWLPDTSCSTGCGIELVSPALQGRVLTTGPPGKRSYLLFLFLV